MRLALELRLAPGQELTLAEWLAIAGARSDDGPSANVATLEELME